MEEKKLTDEELVNALDNCVNGDYRTKCKACYCDKLKNACKQMDIDILDLIHRLQEKIERLTEENEYLDGCAKQFLADYQKCEVELSELEDKCLDCPYQLKFDEIEKQAAKETAKEILQEIKALIDNAKEKLEMLFPKNDRYKKGYENSVKHFEENILEIAKSKGVEVEE